jgi:hypothetical protein
MPMVAGSLKAGQRMLPMTSAIAATCAAIFDLPKSLAEIV